MTRTAPRVESLVRAAETLPAGARGVSVGIDRTTVPMEEAWGAPRPHAVPPRLDVKYRMAYVGTVRLVDASGDALVTRRDAIPGDDEPTDLVTRMMADVQRARDQAPRVRVGLIQDAAPELWTLLRDGLRTEVRLRQWDEGIDRYHLNERLAEILRITEPDATQRTPQLARWNDALDQDADWRGRPAHGSLLTLVRIGSRPILSGARASPHCPILPGSAVIPKHCRGERTAKSTRAHAR